MVSAVLSEQRSATCDVIGNFQNGGRIVNRRVDKTEKKIICACVE